VELAGLQAADFPIVEARGQNVSDGMKDASRFLQTVACLATMGFASAAGNDDASELVNAPANLRAKAVVAALLEFPEAELEKALVTRQMSLSAVTETYEVPLNVAQAQGARTALSVALYSHLFGWLIHRVNLSTSALAAQAHYNDNDRFESPRFARDAFNDLIALIRKSQAGFVKALFPEEHVGDAMTGVPGSRPAGAAGSGGAAGGGAGRPQLKRRTSIVAAHALEAAEAVPAAPAGDSDEAKTARAVRELLALHLLPGKEKEYQIGKTRVFFRKGALEALEELRSRKLNAAAVLLQRCAKKWMAMAVFRRIKNACVRVQTAVRGYRQRALYRQQRAAAVVIEKSARRRRAQLLLRALRENRRAATIQTVFRMYVCRRQYQKVLKAIRTVQSVVRMFLAIKSVAVLQQQAKEDAKLENQIQLLKKRLQQEREARIELEQQAIGLRPSMLMRSEDMLEDADLVIDQLRSENAALKDTNAHLKTFSAQMRKEKEVMERGAYVNGASFAAANQRNAKLQEEVEMLRSAQLRYKEAHRMMKMQNLAAMEKLKLMQGSLNEAMGERMALRQSVDHLRHHTEHLQSENVALSKANARLRLILRQDPELSRKHRDEVPRLTKLAFSSKQPGPPKAPSNVSNIIKAVAESASVPVVNMRVSLSSLQPPQPPMAQLVSPPMRPQPPTRAQPPLPTQALQAVAPTPIKRANSLSVGGAVKKAETQRVVNIREVSSKEVEEEPAAGADKPATFMTIVALGSAGNSLTKEPTATAATTTLVATTTAVSPTKLRHALVRQPTGEDGPIAAPAKVMGIILDEDDEEEDMSQRVSFSVTLGVDLVEEAANKQRNSVVVPPPPPPPQQQLTTTTPVVQPGSYASVVAAKPAPALVVVPGSFTLGSSIGGSSVGGGGGAAYTRRGSYDRSDSGSVNGDYSTNNTNNNGGVGRNGNGRGRRGSYDRSESGSVNGDFSGGNRSRRGSYDRSDSGSVNGRRGSYEADAPHNSSLRASVGGGRSSPNTSVNGDAPRARTSSNYKGSQPQHQQRTGRGGKRIEL
ncbi:hypothetical protein PybrP1_006635, partial [[Pythium] brassicae (nom. inval.)]